MQKFLFSSRNQHQRIIKSAAAMPALTRFMRVLAHHGKWFLASLIFVAQHANADLPFGPPTPPWFSGVSPNLIYGPTPEAATGEYIQKQYAWCFTVTAITCGIPKLNSGRYDASCKSTLTPKPGCSFGEGEHNDGAQAIAACPLNSWNTGSGCRCNDGFQEQKGHCVGLAESPAKNLGPPKPCMEGCVGDPIHAGTGNMFIVEMDVSLPTHSDLGFVRIYNSKAQDFIGLGIGWRHSYNRSVLATPDNPVWAQVTRSDGKTYEFVASGDQSIADADVADKLLDVRDDEGIRKGWQYRVAGDESVENFDASGRLTSIVSRNGEIKTLSYDFMGRLAAVSDSFGRALRFTYDDFGRIDSIVDPAGSTYRYAYASNNNLVSITYPDGKHKQYLYENPNFPHALTAAIDENDNRYATWTYDDQGRALSNNLARDVASVTLAYAPNGVTTVVDALNTSRTFSFQNVWGVVRNSGITQPAISGGGTTSALKNYDGNGNVASRTDFNGSKTTYSYDLSSNLETSRIEGDGTPQAKTLTTQWHPVWRLPVKVAEPHQRTTYVYHGDSYNGTVVTCAPPEAKVGNQPIGVLCQRIEQATQDATGAQGMAATLDATIAARQWSWTYNAVGQVLTAHGPRAITDEVSYLYYDTTDPSGQWTRGDLRSVTDALGHTTQYLRYNRHGQPLERVDANGLVTLLTYDARQRLLLQQTGEELTRYDYDGVGQLTNIASSDGTTITLSYDAAHRLIGITDSLGNRISYALDAMGNRIQETIHDPNGTLTDQLERRYDALGRLQQHIAQ